MYINNLCNVMLSVLFLYSFCQINFKIQLQNFHLSKPNQNVIKLISTKFIFIYSTYLITTTKSLMKKKIEKKT